MSAENKQDEGVWLTEIFSAPDLTPEERERMRQENAREIFRQLDASDRLEGIETDDFLRSMQEKIVQGTISVADAFRASVKRYTGQEV
jgi:predicted O-methyltransferase YrrM